MATFKQTQANKKKREQLLEMINKGYTPEFIKFASYANGGNVSEVETELNALNDLGFGGEDPNQVEVEGRKFKINTLADQAAYNKLESAKTEASGLAESALSDFDLKLTQLETAITDKKGLAAAVGTNFLGRAPIASKFEGDKQRFLGTVDQIVSTDALDALISAKSKGATFGALSEGEMKILKSSATRFGTWEVRDKNGEYYNFVGDTIKAFQAAGLSYYNEIILLNVIGTACVRAGKYMNHRNVAKIHQNVLVFYKGDPKEIKKIYPKLEINIENTELNDK